MHGGSHRFGGSNDYDNNEWGEASTLVAMSDIIVVLVNYRLGPFGFFTIEGTEAKGNQGFLDQNLAFKWVYENAPYFGGDPTRITIGGESAGSWDIGLHLLYKQSWPYFSNAIMESGNPADLASHLRTPEEASRDALTIGRELGFDVNDRNSLLKSFQSMSTESFYKAMDKSFKKLVELFIPLVLDPEIFEQQPKILLQNGDFKRCNILIGTNTIEAYEFIDEKCINKHLLKEKLADNP